MNAVLVFDPGGAVPPPRNHHNDVNDLWLWMGIPTAEIAYSDVSEWAKDHMRRFCHEVHQGMRPRPENSVIFRRGNEILTVTTEGLWEYQLEVVKGAPTFERPRAIATVYWCDVPAHLRDILVSWRNQQLDYAEYEDGAGLIEITVLHSFFNGRLVVASPPPTD